MNRVQPDTSLPRAPIYKTYLANITQDTTEAPTVIILQNKPNLEITWTRTDVGRYTGTITNEEYENIDLNTEATVTCQQSLAGQLFVNCADNNIYIITKNEAAGYDDGRLYHAALEIKIY